jgi:beta-phosphoglucomutase
MNASGLPIARGLALIFDLDGVVVDSMPLHTLAWLRYLAQLGISRKDIAIHMHGRRNDEIVREFLGPDVPNEVVLEHGAAKERLFREMMGADLVRNLVPGVADFLARANHNGADTPLHIDSPASAGGAPVALATNAEPANVAFVLDGANLRRWFQAIVDGSQVRNAKPAPDVYLTAGARLGVDPGNCIVFEDSPTGIAAARAAGMRVVGILTHAETLEHVDISVRDFQDPELEQWLASQRAL